MWSLSCVRFHVSLIFLLFGQTTPFNRQLNAHLNFGLVSSSNNVYPISPLTTTLSTLDEIIEVMRARAHKEQIWIYSKKQQTHLTLRKFDCRLRETRNTKPESARKSLVCRLSNYPKNKFTNLEFMKSGNLPHFIFHLKTNESAAIRRMLETEPCGRRNAWVSEPTTVRPCPPIPCPYS